MLDIDPLRSGPEPRAAATVVLLRDGEAGLEVFLVRRTKGASFMGGAHVFPGGKVDGTDADPELLARACGVEGRAAAMALGETIDGSAARSLYVAALRETFEESGVLFASAPDLDLTLDVGALTPLSRWVTPAVEQRRFDARFFVAIAPRGIDARHDQAETISSVWKTPREAIDEHLAARIDLPPPTLRTLEELLVHPSASAAISAIRARRPPLVRPVFRDLAGTFVLALPGDPEHPEPEPVVTGPTRFTLRDGRFVSG
jgi:8-oxo-dGTP pyrophosphatase MutT (NUDIX family)